MKLKEEFIKWPKDMVYDMYLSLVYECKDYDEITRGKMLEEIIKEYKLEHYLYAICTGKELDFLNYIKENKITAKDFKTYAWEMKELHKKCIFSMVTLEVFEEQQENVKEALAYYKTHKKDKEIMDKTITFMVSIVKIYAKILTKAFLSIVGSITRIKEESLDALLGNPLFHFYCGFSSEWIESLQLEEETIIYREYYDILEDLDRAKELYGIAGSIFIDIRDNFDIFYYGFPIQNRKVKKMVEEVNKLQDKDFLFKIIEEARILNDRRNLHLFINEKLLNTVYEALEEMPCAAMNGFTPNAYKLELEKEVELDNKFPVVPQNNAHLDKKEADLYYKLYFALLEFTNKKYKMSKEITKIYKQEGLDAQKLLPIDEYLWNHKELIDTFITENPYKFSKEELEIVKGFKTAVKSNRFIVIGFLEEYTEILAEDGKIYMVKGIRANLDEIMNPHDLPKMIRTTLLMFKKNIIFNGFFSPMEIVLGNDWKEAILKDCQTAIKYYHL